MKPKNTKERLAFIDLEEDNGDSYVNGEYTNTSSEVPTEEQLATSERVKRNFAEILLSDAKKKYKNDTMGLRGILMAGASNRPPTLEDYLKLGLSLSQLSQAERESIQFMLDKSQPKPEDKK